MDNGSMNEKKQELIKALRNYRQELMEIEYKADVKDPLRTDLIKTLWSTENYVSGEDYLRKYAEENARKTTPLTFDERGALAEFKEDAEDLGVSLQEFLLLRILLKLEKK